MALFLVFMVALMPKIIVPTDIRGIELLRGGARHAKHDSRRFLPNFSRSVLKHWQAFTRKPLRMSKT
jgi:hypothetical protein